MWTENLQQQTREVFENMNGAFMKHFGDSQFGLCILIDGKYIIDNRSNDEVYEYKTMEVLLEDEWAID